MVSRLFVLFAVLSVVFCAGCSSEGPPRKETFPVTGEVLVDGVPAEALQVQLHNLMGPDTKMPTHSEAMTDAQGKFAISTYERGDGVPEGEYAVTFFWGKLNVLSNAYEGPDRLKGKYSDPSNVQIKAVVEKGKPTDMGKIQLSTK